MSNFATSTQAQQAFYLAFTEGNIDAMSAVWSEDSDAICIHPGSDILQGKATILQSWSRILSPGMAAKIEIEPVSTFEGEDIAIHIVYEHLHTGPGEKMATVIATNVFRFGASGWQIVEHHGTQPVSRVNAIEHVAPSQRILQ